MFNYFGVKKPVPIEHEKKIIKEYEVEEVSDLPLNVHSFITCLSSTYHVKTEYRSNTLYLGDKVIEKYLMASPLFVRGSKIYFYGQSFIIIDVLDNSTKILETNLPLLQKFHYDEKREKLYAIHASRSLEILLYVLDVPSFKVIEVIPTDFNEIRLSIYAYNDIIYSIINKESKYFSYKNQEWKEHSIKEFKCQDHFPSKVGIKEKVFYFDKSTKELFEINLEFEKCFLVEIKPSIEITDIFLLNNQLLIQKKDGYCKFFTNRYDWEPQMLSKNSKNINFYFY